MPRRPLPGSALLLPAVLLCFGVWFTFAAVQGDSGVLRRIELEAERERLQAELVLLSREAARMRDRTERLSDDYLDLDLLDERARTVLGMARADEIVIE